MSFMDTIQRALSYRNAVFTLAINVTGGGQNNQLNELLRDPPPTTNGGAVVRQPLSEEQRLYKVIVELIETEQQYVKDVKCLLERYLEPLKVEKFMATCSDDVDQLLANIHDIMRFQKVFLRSIEHAAGLADGQSVVMENIAVKVLVSLAASFLSHAHRFKVYSSFCASHSKAQKLLDPDNNAALREFLRVRNPQQQHSDTLESYLIKPIQRIVRYPLLLRQLKDLTDPLSDEHRKLEEALRAMEAVAEHINEMQKIYEEYGCYFEQILQVNNNEFRHGKIRRLDVGQLQMYGSVTWLNALEHLGRVRKDTQLVTILFVFKVGIVILCVEKQKMRKKRHKRHLPHSRPGEDVVRYLAALPVDEIQIRSVTEEGGREATHGLWQLVHSRQERDGRQNTLYQFINSQNARQAYLRTIHWTIRDSLRRHHVLPTPVGEMSAMPSSTSQQELLIHAARPTTLTSRSISMVDSSKKCCRSQRPPYDCVVRYDDSRLPSNACHHQYVQHCHQLTTGGDMCVRSHTLDDLNQVQLPSNGCPPRSDSEHCAQTSNGSAASRTPCSHGLVHDNYLLELDWPSTHGWYGVVSAASLVSPNSSLSTLSSDERGSARLVYSSHSRSSSSSQRPDCSSSGSDLATDGQRPGSPLWKPRSLSRDSSDTSLNVTLNSNCVIDEV